MFLVFNKQKIISYLVAFSTVAILFAGASFFIPTYEETVETESIKVITNILCKNRRKKGFSYY